MARFGQRYISTITSLALVVVVVVDADVPRDDVDHHRRRHTAARRKNVCQIHRRKTVNPILVRVDGLATSLYQSSSGGGGSTKQWPMSP